MGVFLSVLLSVCIGIMPSSPFVPLVFTTGESLRVRASKVIAGQECERTNEFLQAMATAILSKLESSEAVQQVLKGEKPADSIGKGEKKKQRLAYVVVSLVS